VTKGYRYFPGAPASALFQTPVFGRFSSFKKIGQFSFLACPCGDDAACLTRLKEWTLRT
jgi:hypothetical protein